MIFQSLFFLFSVLFLLILNHNVISIDGQNVQDILDSFGLNDELTIRSSPFEKSIGSIHPNSLQVYTFIQGNTTILSCDDIRMSCWSFSPTNPFLHPSNFEYQWALKAVNYQTTGKIFNQAQNALKDNNIALNSDSIFIPSNVLKADQSYIWTCTPQLEKHSNYLNDSNFVMTIVTENNPSIQLLNNPLKRTKHINIGRVGVSSPASYESFDEDEFQHDQFGHFSSHQKPQIKQNNQDEATATVNSANLLTIDTIKLIQDRIKSNHLMSSHFPSSSSRVHVTKRPSSRKTSIAQGLGHHFNPVSTSRTPFSRTSHTPYLSTKMIRAESSHGSDKTTATQQTGGLSDKELFNGISSVNNELHLHGHSLKELGIKFETPLYIYVQEIFQTRYEMYSSAFSKMNSQIYFAVKANSHPVILQDLHKLGSRFEIVSIGEYYLVKNVTHSPGTITFSGVGKTQEELEMVIEEGIGCINVESFEELQEILEICKKLKQEGRFKTKVNLAVRVNPNIYAKTHRHITTGLKESKFGVSWSIAKNMYQFMLDNDEFLNPIGLACHIGSQITDIQPFEETAEFMNKIATHLIVKMNIKLKHIDMGGGLGIDYGENPSYSDSLDTYKKSLQSKINQYASALQKAIPMHDIQLHIEPGRSLIGESGFLLTKVIRIKSGDGKKFVCVDAGFNDLIRPTMYDAFHKILSVILHRGLKPFKSEVVGPVCETGDILGRDRMLAILPGDFALIQDTGAYGFVMALNYNARNRPAIAMVFTDGTVKLIQERERVY